MTSHINFDVELKIFKTNHLLFDVEKFKILVEFVAYSCIVPATRTKVCG